MTATVITTERLILRQIGVDDLDPHMTLLNTPAVMEFLGGVQPRAVIAAKHQASRASFAAHGFGFMLMVERASGEIVGHCGLRHVAHSLAPNPQDHEIGWLVREDRWRMGYAYEAMRAVVDWGFGTFDVPQIVAITTPANRGSWLLMEKLGMVRRPDLDFTDPAMPPEHNREIQYAITRAQWEQATGAGA
ncbi:GNAT family N-acetyltransferase [Erythrobacter colymbi]|uniref:GNAT family N-acetyltransferase n=1 Tax=Erythrobacter colymbi TaxID=1161202 RepID=UPI000A36B877|nr:GNAT family N-acetyltransferase [Erythrobacter colymbi]